MTIRRATTELGTFYHVAEDFYIAGVLGYGVAWERELLEVVRHLLPVRGPCNVVDVGAHIGTHAVPYARWVRGRGRVYAFEPQPVMVALLRRNLETNKCVADVEIFQAAAGHQDGLEVSMENAIRDGPNAGVAFAYEDGTDFNYGGLQLGRGGVRVRMRTLDSFHFDNVGLLKTDAEGADTLVLWGARELIRRWRPIILFERNEKYITESMREMMPIPDEVLAFRIEDYASSLGYLPPVDVGSSQLLLRPVGREEANGSGTLARTPSPQTLAADRTALLEQRSWIARKAPSRSSSKDDSLGSGLIDDPEEDRLRRYRLRWRRCVRSDRNALRCAATP